MALSDDVTNRMASQRLIEVTNDRDSTATTVDTTILGYAATDISADFELLSSENYDSTNAVHVAIAVPAVMGKLYEYQGRISPMANESYDIFVAKCTRLREGNIPGPATNSVVTVTDPTGTVRKEFDWKNMRDYKPKYPRGTSGTTTDDED